MGFDYLHGEPRRGGGEARRPARADRRRRPLPPRRLRGRRRLRRAHLPLLRGPRPGAADGAPRAAAAGSPPRRGRCTPTRPASAPPAARKYARTGWSRGYMLRRYGVMSQPRAAAAGARLRGRDLRRPAAARPHRRRASAGGCAAGATAAASSGATPARRRCSRSRPRGAGAAPAPARLSVRASRATPTPSQRRARAGSPSRRRRRRSRSSRGSQRRRRELAAAGSPAGGAGAAARTQRAGLDRGDPRQRRGGHELDLGGEPVAGDQARVLGAGTREARPARRRCRRARRPPRARRRSASRRSAPAR